MNMNERPYVTLFMLVSADGRISCGSDDSLDFDMDLPLIDGVKEGLGQYYEIEQTTDLFSFNTGRVMAKTGVNTKPLPKKTPVTFVILDNTHLTEDGVRWLCAKSKDLIIVTSSREHPAYSVQEDNLHILLQEKTDLKAMLEVLKKDYGCERLTVQSGSTLNSMFLRESLIDAADLVIAPLFVGGTDTPSLIGGISAENHEELSFLRTLKLESCEVLENSYIRLRYTVNNR